MCRDVRVHRIWIAIGSRRTFTDPPADRFFAEGACGALQPWRLRGGARGAVVANKSVHEIPPPMSDGLPVIAIPTRLHTDGISLGHRPIRTANTSGRINFEGRRVFCVRPGIADQTRVLVPRSSPGWAWLLRVRAPHDAAQKQQGNVHMCHAAGGYLLTKNHGLTNRVPYQAIRHTHAFFCLYIFSMH